MPPGDPRQHRRRPRWRHRQQRRQWQWLLQWQWQWLLQCQWLWLLQWLLQCQWLWLLQWLLQWQWQWLLQRHALPRCHRRLGAAVLVSSTRPSPACGNRPWQWHRRKQRP
jgi:hypothetical protein